MERKKNQVSQKLSPLKKFPQEVARESVRKGIEAREALLQQIDPIRTMTREQIEILLSEIPELAMVKKNGKTYLGSYEVRDELGQGGRGVVYRVWDPNLEREAVLKEIKPGMSSENEVLQFIRELRTMAKLNHRHVVNIYNAGKYDKPDQPSIPFFIMEKCQGDANSQKKALSEMSKLEKLDWAETNLVGLAEALHLAHEKGFVHGDVKPSNMLIQGNDWKLSDFGYAHSFLHSPEDYEMTYGTPVYMAPEYIMSQPNKLTPETDFYALGMSMFEILTRTKLFGDSEEGRGVKIFLGRMYYEKKFPPKAQEKIIRNLRKSVPKHLGECLLKMIQPDPKQRIPSSKVVESLREAIQKDKEDYKNLKDPNGLEDVPLEVGTEALVTLQGKDIQIRGRVTMGEVEHKKLVEEGLLPPLRFITLDEVDAYRLEDALGLTKKKYELLFDEMSHELICRRKGEKDEILKMEINKILSYVKEQKQRKAS